MVKINFDCVPSTPVMVTSEDMDFGLVPWTTDPQLNQRTLLDIANEFDVTVTARNPVTNGALLTVSPEN